MTPLNEHGDPPGAPRVTGRQLRELLADDAWLDELIDRSQQGGVQLTGAGRVPAGDDQGGPGAGAGGRADRPSRAMSRATRPVGGRRTRGTGRPRRRCRPRSGRSRWTCRGTGRRRFEPRLVPKGATPPRRPGRADHQPLRRRDDGPRHPGPPGPHARHRAVPRHDLQDHRRGPGRGQGLAVPAVGGALPDRLPGRDRGERSATGTRSGTRPRTSPSASTWTASSTFSGSGCRPPRARSSGPGSAPSCANRGVKDVLIVCCDGLTGLPGGDRGDLAADHRADLRGAPDPGLDAVRVLHTTARPSPRR